MSKIENNIINSIKMLSVDMINKAGSGHPGVALDIAPILYTLYVNNMKVRPKDPKWINRDRLVLSNGHASASLYATLHMAGFDIGMDDLKEFRRINSITPGHPEYKVTPGVDVSTGPLGQGIANAVGIALAERYISSLIKNINPKNNIIDYYTYCVCGDGDLMEGISYEALSFASNQNLNKLILIYDANNMTLDGPADVTFNDNIEDRFLSLDMDVIKVKHGTNIADIDDAIKEAKKNKRPTVVMVNTIIGSGSENENTAKVHGKPLSQNDLSNLRRKFGFEDSFNIPAEYYEYIQKTINKRMSKYNEKWSELYTNSRRVPKINGIISALESGELNFDFNSDNYKMSDNYNEDIRLGNKKIFNLFASKSSFILSGNADVATSTNMVINNEGLMREDKPTNRNIAFGTREHAMAGILNGMALSNLKVFGSTYLVFSDYMKPAIRMSAMMNLPVTYVFTHDSLLLGYDGPTHEPVEQLSSLRLIPELITFRPADINEVMGCYEFISKHRRTVAISLGKEKKPKIKGTNPKYVSYGAYRIKREKGEMNAIIIATGSEVEIAMQLAEQLLPFGIDVRVVSMPSVELFLRQNPRYEEQLLPKNVKTFAIEFGSSLIWNRFVTSPEFIIGLDKFGKSGKKEEILNEYNLDMDAIKTKIIELMKK